MKRFDEIRQKVSQMSTKIEDEWDLKGKESHLCPICWTQEIDFEGYENTFETN